MTVPAADKLRVDYVSDEHTYAESTLDRFANMNTAADLLDAIDALHQSWPDTNWCSGCDWWWPCPTARLLHPEAGERRKQDDNRSAIADAHHVLTSENNRDNGSFKEGL